MDTYRVRPGCELPHEGVVLASGADLELAPHIAVEVRHLVDPVNPATKKIMAWPSKATSDLDAELARARPHERISLLEQAAATTSSDLGVIQAKIAAERKRLADTGEGPAETPKPAPVAVPSRKGAEG